MTFNVNRAERRPVSRPTACEGCEIRSLTFCSVLSPHESERIQTALKNIDVPAHATLFQEGDPADHLFNVTAGVVKLYKLLPDGRRQITGFLFPGDFLGLAYGETYVYSAETVTPAALCRFSRTKLLALFDEIPHMEKHISMTTSHELAAAQDQMLLLGRKTAQEKIASFLLMLLRRLRPHAAHPPKDAA
jgi:CRP/FNR family transcriptional regulator